MTKNNKTKEIHAEIDRIRAVNEGISEVFGFSNIGDEILYLCKDGYRIVAENTLGEFRFIKGEGSITREEITPILSKDQIKTLFRDLHNAGLLGENPNQLPDAIRIRDEDGTEHQLWVANGTKRVWYVSDTYEGEIMATGNTIEESKSLLLEELKDYDIIKKEYAHRQSQALALQIKWFNDIESGDKLLPSLWETDEEKVLSELWEILKGIK